MAPETQAQPRAAGRTHPPDVVAEALEGFERAHSHLLRWNREPSYVVRAEPPLRTKVGLVSGGGSGHEPLHVGFVGTGMLDAAVPGAVLTAPTALQVAEATRAVDGGAGVVQVVEPGAGELLTFRIAAEIAADEGVRVHQVVLDEGSAAAAVPGAAVLAVQKVCGAAAEAGADVVQVAELGRRVAAASRTVQRPAAAQDGAGAARIASALGPEDLEQVVAELGARSGDGVLVIVNGPGPAHPMQLAATYRDVARCLDSRGVRVVRSLVGSYVTALDGTGCSVTLVTMDDDLVRLWDAPVRTAALTW